MNVSSITFTPVAKEVNRIYAGIENIQSISDKTFELLLGRNIPEQVSIRPFHNNSTIADISTTFIGSQVKKSD